MPDPAQPMRMIYVGTLATAPDRDSGWMREFAELGWEVVPFSTRGTIASGFLNRVKRRFHVGAENRRMQQALLALVAECRPTWVHFRLPIDIDRKTIEAIRSSGALVTQYFNDDPFSRSVPFGLHWKFRRALSAYDGHFVFRPANVDTYRKAGARHVEHCPPTYDQLCHTPARRRTDGTFHADAAFVGHWEKDWRTDCLEALHRSGLKLILRGGDWDRHVHGRDLSALSPIEFAHSEDYIDIYANVIAGLCFFSKINRDSWTRRALEIIAVGGVLVCERTVEAMSYFEDGKEAFFFSSIDELIAICRLLKTDPKLRERVRKAGYARLLAGNHAIGDRAARIHQWVMASTASNMVVAIGESALPLRSPN